MFLLRPCSRSLSAGFIAGKDISMCSMPSSPFIITPLSSSFFADLTGGETYSGRDAAAGPGGSAGISLLLAFTYLVAALKGMYGQSLGMAFVKALGISLLYLIFILLALGLLIVTTFLWY